MYRTDANVFITLSENGMTATYEPRRVKICIRTYAAGEAQDQTVHYASYTFRYYVNQTMCDSLVEIVAPDQYVHHA